MDMQPIHRDILLALYRGEVDAVDDLPYIAFEALKRGQLVTEVRPSCLSIHHTLNKTPMLTPAGLEKCRELFGVIEHEPKTASAIRIKDDD